MKKLSYATMLIKDVIKISFIYAMSDIHGDLECFEEALSHVDLESNPQSKLILLGDYIDGEKYSCEVLYRIKELADKYGERVVALRGNHEEDFLEWLFDSNVFWLSADVEFRTTKSFCTDEQFQDIQRQARSGSIASLYTSVTQLARTYIKESHSELLSWMKAMPYFYETDKQIFVHAGVDEEAEDWWELSTTNDIFVGKYPAQTGKFYKDIIAGHMSTSTVAGDRDFHDIYWDGKSHYYIDGSVHVSRYVPVLRYDTETGKYSG